MRVLFVFIIIKTEYPPFYTLVIDGRIMVWRCPSVVRPSVCSVVHNSIVQDIYQNLCGLNLGRTLYIERARSLFIFRVKGQLSRSLGLYEEFWHLDPCGQDIAKTTSLGCSNLVCILHMEKGRHLFFKGQRSKSLGLNYNEFQHLDPCGQDKARTMQSSLLKLSKYTSYGSGRSQLNF